MRARAAIVVVILCGACAAEEEPPVPLNAEMVIGSAAPSGAGFVEVADGATVELIPGSQGGFHVWTGLRVKGAAGELFLNREARQVSDGTLVLRTENQYVEVPDAAMEEWWERDEATASFMCPAPVGVRMYGTELAFTAQLFNMDGELVAEDHLVLAPACPVGEQQAFCLNVCDGT